MLYIDTYWNILNILVYTQYTLKIIFTCFFLVLLMGLLENFNLSIWLALDFLLGSIGPEKFKVVVDI